MKALKYLDLLNDNNIEFTTHKNFKKTYFGALSTILLAFLFVELTYEVIYQYFTKTGIKTSIEHQNSIENKEFVMDGKFNFGVSLKYDNYYELEGKYLYFEAYYINKTSKTVEKLDMFKCNSDFYNMINNKNNKDYYFSTENYWCFETKNRKFNKEISVSVEVKLCLEGRTNPYTLENCARADEYKTNKGRKTNVVIKYSDVYYDKNNLEKGLLPIAGTYFDYIDTNYETKSFLVFEKSMLDTYKDYITSSKFSEEEYSIKSIESKFTSLDNIASIKSVYTVDIKFDSSYVVYIRQPVKIDDVLSKIGGIYQMIVIIINLIVKLYSENCFYLHMTNNTEKLHFKSFTNIRRQNIFDPSADSLQKLNNLNVDEIDCNEYRRPSNYFLNLSNIVDKNTYRGVNNLSVNDYNDSEPTKSFNQTYLEVNQECEYKNEINQKLKELTKLASSENKFEENYQSLTLDLKSSSKEWTYFKILCSKVFCRKTKLVNGFNKVKEEVEKKLDVITYFDFILDYSIVKHLLFNQEQQKNMEEILIKL